MSDIVLLKELPEACRQDEKLIAGCVGGAILRDEYLRMVKNAGFKLKTLSEDTGISRRQYGGIPLESLRLPHINITDLSSRGQRRVPGGNHVGKTVCETLRF